MGLQYGKTAAGAQRPAGTVEAAQMRLSRSGIIVLLIVAAISLYALAGIAATEAEAAEYESLLAELGERAAELRGENGALSSALSRASEDETIERAARSCGLVYPDEVIFQFAGGRDK